MILIRATSVEWWGQKLILLGSGGYWQRQIRKPKVSVFVRIFYVNGSRCMRRMLEIGSEIKRWVLGWETQ